MSTLQIDTIAARRAANAWIEWGNQAQRTQLAAEADFDGLELGVGVPTVSQALGTAATELWLAGAFVLLVAERAESADGAPFDSAALNDLQQLAGIQVYAATGGRPPAGWLLSSGSGELGGTFGSEVRSPFVVTGDSPLELGRALVIRALLDTASGAQIRADEFEIVRLPDGKYLVVLPGVTDLSKPDLGYSDTHRSVRDVDQAAYPSSMSTSVADNRYAQMVWDALRARGVPLGSELMIVGHSFGADTALDLAADSGFNGAGGYQVTHVVAAAYDSRPQLAHVPASTQVLVLQNNRDVPVIGEAVGNAHVTATVDAGAGVVGSLWDGDVIGVFANAGDAVFNGIAVGHEATWYTVTNAGDIVDVIGGVQSFDPGRVVEGAHDFVTRDPGTDRPTPSQTVTVFEGGFAGAGHHQDNYIDFLETTTDPAVSAFLASVASAGFATAGSAHAVDVSAPR